MCFGGDEESTKKGLQILSIDNVRQLATVVPGDFNADLITDLLLIYNKHDKLYHIELCLGSASTLTHYTCQNVTDSSLGEPMIFEYVIHTNFMFWIVDFSVYFYIINISFVFCRYYITLTFIVF